MMKLGWFQRNKGIDRRLLLCFLVFFGIFLSVFLLNNSYQKESFAGDTELTNADCVKCHSAVQGTVGEKGGKHKSAVTCMGCHKGHPPMVSKDQIIPACSMCHAGKTHYELEGCNTCHSDPHAPLSMKLAANLTAPCLTCHEKEGKALVDKPSLHSKLFCTTCHKSHREVPECLKCHQPHSAEMVNKDCLACHPAHQPRTIVFGQDMPSKNCATCHQAIFDTLSRVDSKHSKLSCVFCHKDNHGYVPACESCHGTTHPPAMLAQFPKCNMCHMSAHSLGKEAK